MGGANECLKQAHGFIVVVFLVPSAISSNQSSNVVTDAQFFSGLSTAAFNAP